MALALASVERSGGEPYAVPAGASDHPLGGLGFARWADEVAEQERELGVFLDTVVVCSVTGSTQAGMIAGFAAPESERAVLGIDGSATVAQTWGQIARIARFTAEEIGLGRDLDVSEIVQRAERFTLLRQRRRGVVPPCAPLRRDWG